MDNRSGVAIAEVAKELKAGRIGVPYEDKKVADQVLAKVQLPGPVIDATQIYHSLVDNPKPVYIYEDHPCISPPWVSAIVGYVNEHDNVVLMHMFSEELSKGQRSEKWEAADLVDWAQVRWITQVTVWIGGRSNKTNLSVPLMGPLHMWLYAVGESGAPMDIRWVQFRKEYPIENWDMAQLVVLGALNFMNCRNVDIVEPSRRRAEARQISRTGVRVSVINVFPTGKSTRSESANKGCGVPLTSVRGHFSCYGPEYGKGLLFGKLAGRFWIPQHARGNKELGEVQNSYVLKPGPA